MSGGGGEVGASKSAGPPIPAGARKLVQRLKEIVNWTESEIYAMLRECNMDPDEAINRLLAQDTFQEVKSKRDKKKEIKDPPESRSRAVNNSSGRGPRIGPDHGGRSNSSQMGSIDYGVSHSKTIGKEENGANDVPTSLMPETNTRASNPSLRSTVSSYSVENTLQATNLVDGYSTPSQTSPYFQNNWLGKPGHVSMADIVKTGRPQGKPSNMVQNASIPTAHYNVKPPTSVTPSESEKKIISSQELVLHIPEFDHHIGAEDQHIAHDGWSIVDVVPETSHVSDLVPASSNLVVHGVDFNIEPHIHEAEVPQENLSEESQPAEPISVPTSDKQMHLEASGDAHLLKITSSYQSERQGFEHDEGTFPVEDVSVESSVAANLHQMSLHDESSTKVVEPNPAVIIPDHLQVTNADCAQLSFGSFASGAFAGSFSAKAPQSNVKVSPVTDDTSSMDQSDSRNEYYNNGQLQPTLSEDVPSRSDISTENLDTSSVSQAEASRNGTLGSTHDLGYELPSASYAYSSTAQPNASTFTYPQGNAQMQNLSSFSSLMQSNTLQNNLSPNVPALRDFDLALSHLLTTQSISTKYINAPSAIGTPNISVQEAVKQGFLSDPQPSQQNLVSTTIPTGLTPQQLAAHHYAQQALPLGPFANMISYPFLPPSYSYLPSAAFQQTYPANGPFHRSPAAVPNAAIKYDLPQYKNSVSLTSLPQSAAIASAYGSFGSSTNIPGNFSINPSNSSASTTAGFGEALGFQYREANQYMPLQQGDNPALWVQNAGSRTMSALPASAFYDYQSQSQQSGFSQSQQPSQFGALGYPNFYQSQPGASQEHQQNPNQGNLNSSQSSQSQPGNHLWQHGY